MAVVAKQALAVAFDDSGVSSDDDEEPTLENTSVLQSDFEALQQKVIHTHNKM